MAKFLDDLYVTGNNANVLVINSDAVADILLVSNAGAVAVGSDNFVGNVYTNPKFIINTGSGIPGLMHLNSFGVELVTYTNVGDSLFGNASNHDLAFITNDVERIKITAAGAVGINHLTPPAQLTIVGAGNTSATHALRIGNSASDVLLDVQDDGKVGIGTAAPNYKLEVRGSNNSTITMVSDLSTNIATAIIGSRALFGTTSAHDVGFITGATERLTILSTGKVGINTTTPTATLDVKGANSIVMSVKQLSSALPAMFQLLNDNDTTSFSVVAHNSASGTPNRASISTGHGKDLDITLGSSPAGTFRIAREDAYTVPTFFINGSNERIGIGTATPTSKLHIIGVDATSSNYSLKIDNSAATNLLSIKNDGEIDMNGFTIRQLSSYTIFKTSGSNGYLFNNLADNTNLARLTNTGVLILNQVATLNPGVQLSVQAAGTDNSNKENIAEFTKKSTNNTGIIFASKEGVSYIQGVTTANGQTVDLILGGYDGAGNQLETIILNNTGKVGISVSPNVKLDVDGDFATRSAASATAITADTNDLSTSGRSFIRLDNTAAASKNVTGLANGFDGKRLVIANVGADDIVLTNQDSGSVAANRIITGNAGTSTTVKPNDSIELIYDAVTSRWRIINL